MILALYLHKGYLTTEEFQGGEHLETLDEGHVGVGIAMKEQQGRVNLIGIEQGRLIHV